MSWPRPLEHFLRFPEEPVCPQFCPFSTYCKEWVQQGINRSFVDMKLKSHTDCFVFQGLRQLCLETELLGRIPENADDFREMVETAVERDAIREDG
jgi:hypothetical protein